VLLGTGPRLATLVLEEKSMTAKFTNHRKCRLSTICLPCHDSATQTSRREALRCSLGVG
jgi:hypothetical protein